MVFLFDFGTIGFPRRTTYITKKEGTALSSAGMGFGLFGVFGAIIYLGLLGLSIYCLILFIKLAHRGIQALDLYIDEKKIKRDGGFRSE